eukprot:3940428-Rhodomonas_salina.2
MVAYYAWGDRTADLAPLRLTLFDLVFDLHELLLARASVCFLKKNLTEKRKKKKKKICQKKRRKENKKSEKKHGTSSISFMSSMIACIAGEAFFLTPVSPSPPEPDSYVSTGLRAANT